MLWFAIDTKSLKAPVYLSMGIHLNTLGTERLALFHSYVLRVSMFRDSGKKIAKGEIDKLSMAATIKEYAFRTDLMFSNYWANNKSQTECCVYNPKVLVPLSSVLISATQADATE